MELENNYYTNYAHSYLFFILRVVINLKRWFLQKKLAEESVKSELHNYILDIQEQMNCLYRVLITSGYH